MFQVAGGWCQRARGMMLVRTGCSNDLIHSSLYYYIIYDANHSMLFYSFYFYLVIYRLIDEVLGHESGDKVPMEKVVMLIWQFRDDPQVVKFMTRFVAKVREERLVLFSLLG
jgi:hypothetical protein